MRLDEVCNANLYETNVYAMLGLEVGATPRMVRRRGEDLEGVHMQGRIAWRRECGRILLGQRPDPTLQDVKEALVKVTKYPECAQTDAFFWFWPAAAGSDDHALRHLQSGKRDLAFECWKKTADGAEEESAVIARHNLAVLFHLYALDAEKRRLAGRVECQSDSFLNVLDGFWTRAIGEWTALFNRESLWRVFSEMVRRANDPRLKEDFITSFRLRLPAALGSIIAQFLAAYEREGRTDDAKRHFGYLEKILNSAEARGEAIRGAYASEMRKTEMLLANCGKDHLPHEWLDDVKVLLADCRPLVESLTTFARGADQSINDFLDGLASICHSRVRDYVQRCGGHSDALETETYLLSIATSASLRREIEGEIGKLREVIQAEREKNTCWYCKRYQNMMPKFSVMLYKTTDNKETDTINVPVCDGCRGRFSLDTVADYPEIRKKLDSGWSLT